MSYIYHFQYYVENIPEATNGGARGRWVRHPTRCTEEGITKYGELRGGPTRFDDTTRRFVSDDLIDPDGFYINDLTNN